jgi:hypothetical protein
VSLRRRVDTVNRIVEAANENQAILRASQQQRSLGFMIKEAKIVKEKEKTKKKEVVADSEKTEVAAAGGMKEGFDPEPADIATHLVKKHGKGKVTKDHVDAYERDRDSNKAIDKEAVMKHVQKMSENVEQVDEQSPAEIKAKYYHDQFDKVKPVKAYDKDGKLVGHYRSMAHAKQMKPGHTYKEVKEEVESIDEGVATAQKVMDRANVVAKTNPDPKKRFAASGLAQKAMLRTINPTGVNTGIVRGGGNKTYRKVTGKVPPYQLTPKTGVSEEVVTEASKEGKDVMRGMRASLKSMDLRHGVDSDKREAGYKMSPAVKAAQAKSDALSKTVKRPQAGTLAAAKMRNEEVEYIEEKLTAGDPASKWISDFVASENPKFAGKTKKERINMALGAYYAAKKGKNEEVEHVEHVEEAADPGKLRVVNKKVEAQASKETKTSEKKSKATEKAINAAKSKKNPVNLKPVLAADKVNNA